MLKYISFAWCVSGMLISNEKRQFAEIKTVGMYNTSMMCYHNYIVTPPFTDFELSIHFLILNLSLM